MKCPFKKIIDSGVNCTVEEFGECDEYKCMAYSITGCSLCSDQRIYNLEVHVKDGGGIK